MLWRMNKPRLVRLTDIPQSCIGAPLPCMLCGSEFSFLLYITQEPDPTWDGTQPPRLITAEDRTHTWAVIRFDGAYEHRIGGPNDEGLHEQPLYKHGLRCHDAYEIFDSNAEESSDRRFIFTFKDHTFECSARSFEVSFEQGALREIASQILLGSHDR